MSNTNTSNASTAATGVLRRLEGQRGPWQQYYSVKFGMHYYVNVETSETTWKKPHVWSAPYEEQNQQFGRTILEERKGRHSPWALGGFAELLHNSKDACATVVKIRRFPTEDAEPYSADFGIRVDDNGVGMGYADMKKMMKMGSDVSYSSIEDKVGGYGVGFKAGSMALGHTAVVISRGTSTFEGQKVKTVCIGLLSNEPWEARGEPPILGSVIAVDSATGKHVGTTTHNDVKDLYETLSKLNSSITEFFIGNWITDTTMNTTILIVGLRKGLAFTGKVLDDFAFVRNRDPQDYYDDIVLLDPYLERSAFVDDKRLAKHNTTNTRGYREICRMCDVHPGPLGDFRMKEDRGLVPQDHSLRNLCRFMFVENPNRSEVKVEKQRMEIIIFNDRVRQCKFDATEFEGGRCQPLTFDVGGRTIDGVIGSHPYAKRHNLYGVFLYFQSTLIAAYQRNNKNVKHIAPRDEYDRFGTVMVVWLEKDVDVDRSFVAGPEKLDFQQKTQQEPFWNKVTHEFNEYIDELGESKYPGRKECLQTVDQVKKLLDGWSESTSHEPQGPLRGILYLPEVEEETDHVATFRSFVKNEQNHEPISLREITNKLKAMQYPGRTVADKVRGFGNDLQQMCDDAIAWHSRGRWVPDTDDDLDVNAFTAEDIMGVTVKPFVTPSEAEEKVKGIKACKPLFNIPGILKHLDIPPEFLDIVIEQNRDAPGFKDVTASNCKTLELDYGTTLLVPHRDDVKAVTFAKRLRDACEKEVRSIAKKFAMVLAADDSWAQCVLCHKWRLLNQEQYAIYSRPDTQFRCKDISRSCGDIDETPTGSSLSVRTVKKRSTVQRYDDSDAGVPGKRPRTSLHGVVHQHERPSQQGGEARDAGRYASSDGIHPTAKALASGDHKKNLREVLFAQISSSTKHDNVRAPETSPVSSANSPEKSTRKKSACSICTKLKTVKNADWFTSEMHRYGKHATKHTCPFTRDAAATDDAASRPPHEQSRDLLQKLSVSLLDLKRILTDSEKFVPSTSDRTDPEALRQKGLMESFLGKFRGSFHDDGQGFCAVLAVCNSFFVACGNLFKNFQVATGFMEQHAGLDFDDNEDAEDGRWFLWRIISKDIKRVFKKAKSGCACKSRHKHIQRACTTVRTQSH
eukprot:m.107975 g.107975  ORF g.107975 m.107975 type:complete len:1136 (-) comp16938_c0_seq2:100-3507(-)